MLNISVEQMARLLFKSLNEPRRNQKRFLKDLGGDGSAEELDRVLQMAREDPEAVSLSRRLERQREITARTVELGVDGRVAEMLADVRVRMEERGLTQSDVAAACGWQHQVLVSQYLSGAKEPGARNLAKLAAAVGCVWRLQRAENISEKNPEGD